MPSPGRQPQVSVSMEPSGEYDAAYERSLPRAVEPPRLARASKTGVSGSVFGGHQPRLFRSEVVADTATRVASDAFDFCFKGSGGAFTEPVLPALGASWRLGLIRSRCIGNANAVNWLFLLRLKLISCREQSHYHSGCHFESRFSRFCSLLCFVFILWQRGKRYRGHLRILPS